MHFTRTNHYKAVQQHPPSDTMDREGRSSAKEPPVTLSGFRWQGAHLWGNIRLAFCFRTGDRKPGLNGCRGRESNPEPPHSVSKVQTTTPWGRNPDIFDIGVSILTDIRLNSKLLFVIFIERVDTMITGIIFV